MLPWIVIIRSTFRRRSPKSLPLNSFADTHPLTPVPSILYKKHGGRGTKPLLRSDVRSLHHEGGHGTQFASRIELSHLECAVTGKHRVLPVFSRRRPESSPLDATLLSIPASVDSKWFTDHINPFRCNTYKKHRGGAGVQSLGFTEHAAPDTGHGTRSTHLCPILPIAAQPLWCHNPQRCQVSLRSEETTPLPSVSKNSERTSGTVHRRSRSQAARTYERTCKKA